MPCYTILTYKRPHTQATRAVGAGATAAICRGTAGRDTPETGTGAGCRGSGHTEAVRCQHVSAVTST